MKYSTILFSNKPSRDLSLIFKDFSYQGLKYLETKSHLYIKLFTLTQPVSLDLKIHTPGCRFSSVPHCCCLVTQWCLTLCDPMDCSPPGSSVHGDSPGRNTGMGCHFLLQGIFPTQGLNLYLLNCLQILYQLSHQGSPWSSLVIVMFCLDSVSPLPHPLPHFDHLSDTSFKTGKVSEWVRVNESHSVTSDSLWPMDYTVHGILQARILG